MIGNTNQLSIPEFTDTTQWRPVIPTAGTLTAEALSALLSGGKITHRDFIDDTYSWRLSAYIKQLRADGWPVIAVPITKSLRSGRRRAIARYELESWAIQAHKESKQ